MCFAQWLCSLIGLVCIGVLSCLCCLLYVIHPHPLLPCFLILAQPLSLKTIKWQFKTDNAAESAAYPLNGVFLCLECDKNGAFWYFNWELGQVNLILSVIFVNENYDAIYSSTTFFSMTNRIQWQGCHLPTCIIVDEKRLDNNACLQYKNFKLFT